MSNDLDRIAPNRPDVIGFWPDSPSETSKYVDAIQRVVAAIKARAAPVNREDVRGKRRISNEAAASNTIKTYLKSVEIFSFWMQGTFGYELDPKDVTRKVTFDYLQWLMSTDPPNVHIIKTKAAGGQFEVVMKAVERADSLSKDGEFNIQDIYEQLSPTAAAVYDPQKDEFVALHKVLAQIVLYFRSITRIPSIAKIRNQKKTIYSKEERNPLTYRYRIKKRTTYKASTASTHISVLSTVWTAMTEGENTAGGQAPLRYNPWKGPRGAYSIARNKKREDKRRTVDRVISNPIVDALLETTAGADFESRRNRVAIYMMIYTGMRAEELVGLIRKDLVTVDDVLAIQVYGKGDKYRILAVYSEVRDVLAQLDAKLQEISQRRSQDEDEQWKIAYATTLLQSKNAPIIPALPRWGANGRKVDPAEAALEPLDTSGLRAILNKLIEKVRVYDRSIRSTRPLNQQERSLVHPHALRHYAATAAREAGLPTDEIKRMLGHKDLRTTEGYIHVAPRSMAQIGAYIARARAGAVMTPAEASQLHKSKISVLEDPNIMPAPAYDPSRRSVVTKPEPKRYEPKPEKAPEKKPDEAMVSSPVFAYQKNGEQRELYLPAGYSASSIPKGQGVRLTFRVGEISKLPWWAGRANTWDFEKMAPIVSFFQMFQSQYDSIQPELEQLWDRVLENQGVTAAAALAEWVAEILGYASAMFFDTMYSRKDEDGLPPEWISFDEAAKPSEEVVRMHPTDRIVDWFKAHAMAAEAPTLRAPPNWMRWDGTVKIIKASTVDEELTNEKRPVYETVIKVEKLPGFEDYFKPKADKGSDIDIFKPGTGKNSKRLRYRAKAQGWQHGIVVDKETDPMDPFQALITIKGDPLPDNFTRLEASWDLKRTEKEKQLTGFYPKLADLEALPDWFFEDDPIRSLPQDEREKLREWIEKLQGQRLSRVRVTSNATELYEIMRSWHDQKKDLENNIRNMSTADVLRAKESIKEYESVIRKVSEDRFTVEVDPNVIMGSRGGSWAKSAKETTPEAFEIMAPTALDKVTERRMKEAGATVEDMVSWAKLLPATHKRIFAYVQMKLGFNIPITSWGLSQKVIKDNSGLFAAANITWEGGTIVHSRAFKEQFLRAYGTDSECVVRRMIRDLWERKKKHIFEYNMKNVGKQAPPMPRSTLHRHVNTLMAYLVPCPSAMERQLKESFDRMRAEGIKIAPKQEMDDMFDMLRLGRIKEQPRELRRMWLTFMGQDPDMETKETMEAAIKAETPEVFVGGSIAMPNAEAAATAMPNFVTLVFAEYWPV